MKAKRRMSRMNLDLFPVDDPEDLRIDSDVRCTDYKDPQHKFLIICNKID